MNKQELLDAMKLELDNADDTLSNFKRQYTQLEQDIEYWERNCEALRTTVSRLGIEIARRIK